MRHLILFAVITLFNIQVKAQCSLSMTYTIDAFGNIVTTNNSVGADPNSYIWYVYNTDMNPWMAEYLESANTITYAPLYVGNYMVCLVATEMGTNNACDSLCDPFVYTASMMSLQSASGLSELNSVQHVQLYPNPSSGMVQIAADREISSIKAYDLRGTSVPVFAEINGDKAIVDMRLADPGVYFMQLESEGINYTERMVIE